MIDTQSPAGSYTKALKKPKQSERMVQRAIIKEVAKMGFRTAHVPNGAQLAGGSGSRARQMNALKGDGLLVGFPDLILFADIPDIGFLEVKKEGGTQNDNQVKVQAWMDSDGHKYAVVRSVEDTIETLKEWGWI